MIRIATLFLVSSAGIAFCAPIEEAASPLGKVLVAESQMTLYTFDKDAPGVSNCDDACTETWPPLAADETDAPSGAFTVIERADATYQWAVDGKPLYFFAGDQNPGDTLGDNVKGVWHAARP